MNTFAIDLEEHTEAKQRAVIVQFLNIVVKLLVEANATEQEIREQAWNRILADQLTIVYDNKEDIK